MILVRHITARPGRALVVLLAVILLMGARSTAGRAGQTALVGAGSAVAQKSVPPSGLAAAIEAGQSGVAAYLGPQWKSRPMVPAAASPVVSAPYDQVNAAIAYNDGADNYLVVWEDHRYASGADWDIFGRLVASDGVMIGYPFNLTGASSERQMAPDVAYNTTAGQYLVVWEDEYSLTDHDILAQRVASNGSTLGAMIQVAYYVDWDARPAVAYNSVRDEYLVVWQRRIGDAEFGQYDIYARRITGSGTPIGSPIALDTGSASQTDAALAYNRHDDEYLVVWQDRQLGDWDIMGRRVAGDGSLVGGELIIEAPGLDQTRPDVVYNDYRREYLVVWEDRRGGEPSDWDIKAWRLRPDGSRIAWYVISSQGTQRRIAPAVAYKRLVDEYLVAYEYEYSANDHDVKYARMKGTGEMREVDRALSSGTSWEARPAVASDAGRAYLAVWEDGRNSNMALDLYADLVRVYRFTGYVYEGQVGDTSTALPNAVVDLYCSNNAGSLGTHVESTTSSRLGFFALVAAGVCEYYNIVETDPAGYTSAGAESVDGVPVSHNWIQYTYPLDGKELDGNRFWDQPPPTDTPTPTNTPTATPTNTPTSTPTNTPTSTPTNTPTSTPTNTPTSTPTNTPTSTPTNTPTSTPTNTPTFTPTPTSSPEGGTVRGRVHLERRTSDAGAAVSVGALATTTDENGRFTLSGVPAGTHTIIAAHRGYLRSWRSFSLTAGQTLTLPDVTLLGGDVNQDDRIDHLDADIVDQAWHSTPVDGHWDARADITDDKLVNVLDLVAVQFNWGQAGPGPWADSVVEEGYVRALSVQFRQAILGKPLIAWFLRPGGISMVSKTR